MMSRNTDEVNNLLNRIAYAKFSESSVKGQNLITALKNAGEGDLAVALSEAGYGDYVIQDYENHNAPGDNGFVAVAIRDPATGDVGMSFCGTEKMDEMTGDIVDILFGSPDKIVDAIHNQVDMIDNISTAISGDSAQAQEARDFFNRNQSTTGENYLYGHSKGGELAMEVYVDNHEKIAEVHIINAQPIDWADLTPEQLAALNNGKVDATVIDGDLVWMLGAVPYPVRIIKNNGSQGCKFFGPHDLESADYKHGHAQIEDYPYVSYPVQGVLAAGFCSLITVMQGGYEIGEDMVEWMVDAYNFMYDRGTETFQRLWDSVTDAWENAKDFGRDFMDGLEEKFNDATEKARVWWDGLFDRDKGHGGGGGGGGGRGGRGGGGGGRGGRGGGGGGRGGRGGGACGICKAKVDTHYLQQVAAELDRISRDLDSVASNIGSCRRSLQGFKNISSAALRSSLKGSENGVEKQKGHANKLAKTLKEVSKLYEQGERGALQSI